MLEGYKTQLTRTHGLDIGTECLAYGGAGALFLLVALLVTEKVEHVKGSGLVSEQRLSSHHPRPTAPPPDVTLDLTPWLLQPLLIAYLNGCKLRQFTSVRVLVGKFVATALVCASGLCCGPEGPIIHMGACIGKQALRAIYYLEHLPPRRIFGILSNLNRDEDKGVFVAIGAGAGVAAAFSAPLSGTLFVVEEAASHFSLTLLWRAFSAAMVGNAYAPLTAHLMLDYLLLRSPPAATCFLSCLLLAPCCLLRSACCVLLATCVLHVSRCFDCFSLVASC